MSKLLEKVLAVVLVIILASANLIVLGTSVYALTENELAGQSTATQNSNVEFNAYFEKGEHSKTEKVGSKDAKLFLNVKVKNAGYLKNGVVTFEDANFKISDKFKSDLVQSFDIERNQIILNKLNNGSDVTIEVPITILNEDKVSVNNFSKETTVKFTGAYIDGEGKESHLSNSIINKLSWEETAEANVNTELTKFVPYIVNGQHGVMVETKVKANVIGNKLPVKETKIELVAPELNNIKPTSVTAIAKNTIATNGQTDGVSFVKENYNYNQETGLVTIITKNEPNSENKISWVKNVADEYLVTFMYEGQEIYNFVAEKGLNTNMVTKVTMNLYNNNETIKDKTIATELKAEEKIGTLTDFNVNITNQIGKGYLYANYTLKQKIETPYTVEYNATVTNANLAGEITFTQGVDSFMTKENVRALTTVSGKNYTYNKEVKISEAIFTKMLGEEGKVEILTTNNVNLGIINKETKKDTSGNYVLDISEANVNEIVIKTTKPITEGEILVIVEKAIKGNLDYSQEQMKLFTKFETALTGKTGTTTVNASKQMLMSEIKSVANIEVNKKDLTTVVKNENVEIRAILDTSSVYNALYKNPTLKIKLPSYITKIDIKSGNILMANGLKIKNTKITTENGSKVINIELEGMQEEYAINAEYKGTIITLNTDLTVEPLTPSNSNKITMEFTNENEISINKEGKVETELNFVAPNGVVAANQMDNYAEGKPEVMSISDESKTVEIETYTNKRTVTVSGTVINNYSNKIGNVVVLGRFPAKDISEIDKNTNLGATFNTTLKNRISVKGIDSSKYIIYYSEKANATTDLNNKENGWTTTATTTAKSYMIVTKDYEMLAGEKIEFKYDTELPANLSHNNQVYQMYKVYYNNISEIGTMKETKLSPIMKLETGQGPELSAEVTSTAEVVREGQIIKMKATVKNTGEVTAENVKVKVTAPKYTKLVEQTTSGYLDTNKTEFALGNIEKGKTNEVVYYLKVDDNTVLSIGNPEEMTPEEAEKLEASQKFPKEITHQVKITAKGLSGEIPSKEYKMQLQDGTIGMELISDILEDQVLVKGNTIKYALNVTNIGVSGDLKNVIVSIPLPKGIEYKKAVIKNSVADTSESTEGINFDKATNTIKVTIPTLEIYKTIVFEVKIEDFENDISIGATAVADNVEKHYSNVTTYEAENINLEVSELTATPKYIKEGENVTYKLKVTNKGKSTVKGVTITDQIPEGLTFTKATYTYGSGEEAITTVEENKLEIVVSQLAPGKTTEITIIATADLLPNKQDKEVKNQVSVFATSFEEVKTNTVTNIVEYYEGAHTGGDGQDGPGGSTGGNTTGRYKITGTAWVDVDKDGKREEEEALLSGVQVLLLNKGNNKIVVDTDTNTPKQVTTDSNGKYEITNLPKGEYLVVFLYDASKYSLTTYQAQGVDTGLNSDAIDINLTYEGERRVAGITDVLNITNSNVRDIDIGLYTAEKFDLRLDKYINRITLTTPTIGTRVDEYDNDKTGKVEILGANVGKSSIVIEYKIVVKNEGAVPGYAKKIVDYLPKDVNFATDLNKDWYLSDNGNVYNSSLENEKINPGESKEVTLVVTKKLTENSMGSVLNNEAEIFEAHNELGLKDMDSTPGNKADAEDDRSEADVVISLVTGKIILYTTLTIAVLAVIGFSAYVIKKRVLDKKV